MNEDDVRESIKLGFETVKHLTTLNAGSIVLIGTFLTDIFAGPDGILELSQLLKWLIGGSFVLFGLSLGLSATTMWFFSVLVRSELDLASRKKRFRWYIALPSFSFIYGLITFGAAVILNLFGFGQNATDGTKVVIIVIVILALTFLIGVVVFVRRIAKL